MADYFDNAAATDNAAKLDMLGQIAANGSQAANAYQSAQTQIGQAKADALAQALGAAQKRGAPQAEQDQIAATIGHQYDNTLGSLASQAANRAASFGQLSSAGGNYMDEAAAGLPTLRNALAQKVATLQAQARASEGQQQFQLEQARINAANQAATQDLERQRLQLELAKAQNPDLGQIISQLGGADLAGGQLSGALVGNGTVSKGVPGAQGGSLTDQANRAASVGAPEDQFDPTQRLSDGTGIPSAAIGQLVGGYQQKQAAAQTKADTAAAKNAPNPDLGPGAPTPAEINAVKTTRAYKDALDAAKAARDQGWNADQLDKAIQQGMQKTYGHDFPRTRDVVRRMYVSGQL